MYESEIIGIVSASISPIPENDLWWGKGFTEWTNVGKARRYFRNHYQPRVPADLGYYDLRVAETRQAQADMAREYGVEGFVYWHYWFGNGKRLLERPFNEVLASGEPDFPFALAWANESWRGFAHGITNRNMLIEQLYGGVEDYTAHFRAVLPAFRDHRYITVDGKPLFMIYKPLADPEVKVFIATWRELAEKNGTHLDAQQAQSVLRAALADKCAQVLSDAGVYKQNDQGRAGMLRFLATLGYAKKD